MRSRLLWTTFPQICDAIRAMVPAAPCRWATTMEAAPSASNRCRPSLFGMHGIMHRLHRDQCGVRGAHRRGYQSGSMRFSTDLARTASWGRDVLRNPRARVVWLCMVRGCTGEVLVRCTAHQYTWHLQG